MPKKKITPSLIKIILQEKRRAPHLGVRPLSELLKKKHKINFSKSAINKIIISSGLKEKKGRKKSLLIYKGRNLTNCGLFLLRCLDYQVGIFDYLSQELKEYFPNISKDLLRQLVILASFSALINEQPEESAKREGFLRLAGLGHLPIRKLDYFKQQLSRYKPEVDLKPLRKNLILTSTIKFYFNNGHCSYLDAKMSTFWNGPCQIEDFFLPLIAAIKSVKQMVEDKTVIVGYTKSFGHLSSLTFNFLKAIDKGIKKVEFLGERGKVLSELKLNLPKVSFFVGYYPEIVSKGVTFIGKLKGFKSFFLPGVGEFLAGSVLTKFSQIEGNKELIFNNVLIKPGVATLPTWGLITGNISRKKAKIAYFLKKYLYLWPNAEKRFVEDMRIIEKSLFKPAKNKGLVKILPQKLLFKEVLDFVRVGQILSVMFKEVIWGWEPKNKQGDFAWGKDYLRVNLRKMPPEAKKHFNNGHFYLDQRRVFLY